MQFSDTTNDTGLVQDTDFLCDTNATSFPLKDKARLMNRWLYKAVIRALKASGRIEYDDSNLSTLPITTATLVDGQQDYQLPSDHLRLYRVEVKDSNGDYYRLKSIDQQQVKSGLTEFEDTDGMPVYYDRIANSLMLYPAPATADVTTSKGLKIIYSREIDGFTSTDTTQEPGIAEPFHRIISLGTSYDYLIVNGSSDKAQLFRQEAEVLLNELEAFYGDLNRDDKVKIRPAHRRRTYR